MKKWYVKDLSKLTGVSVQTLHYYDRINLLKPSLRLSNGYRVYSEADLMKLQRIIALKYFGFELQQINTLNDDILQSFFEQKRVLQEKQTQLQNIIHTLNKVINDFEANQSVDWLNILNLIGGYQMLSQENYQILLEYEKMLESVLTKEQFDQYLHLKSTRFSSADEYKAYTQEWIIFSDEIKVYLNEDPLSAVGEKLAEKWINLVNRMYPKEYRDLQKTILEKGYKTGKIKNDVFPQKLNEWIAKAVENYHEKQVKKLIDKMKDTLLNHDEAMQQWNDLMQDICGTDQIVKDKFYKKHMSEEIIQWQKR